MTHTPPDGTAIIWALFCRSLVNFYQLCLNVAWLCIQTQYYNLFKSHKLATWFSVLASMHEFGLQRVATSPPNFFFFLKISPHRKHQSARHMLLLLLIFVVNSSSLWGKYYYNTFDFWQDNHSLWLPIQRRIDSFMIKVSWTLWYKNGHYER